MNKQEIIKILNQENFWSKDKVIFDGYSRKMYLNKIKDYLDNSLIKVLVGQRRSGKSFILRELIEFLVQNKKIKRKNILYLKFREWDIFKTFIKKITHLC